MPERFDEKFDVFIKKNREVFPCEGGYCEMCPVEIKRFIQSEKDLSKKEGQEEYKQFILNILDGHDIANAQNGFAPDTNSIRFAINSRVI